MIDTPDDKFNRYSLEQLCYWTIYTIYRNRNRKKYGLKEMRYQELSDAMLSEEIPYTRDIEEIIEEQINKPHGFAPVMVFMQSLDEPLRSIERKTGINICALSRYRKKGKEEILRLCS